MAALTGEPYELAPTPLRGLRLGVLRGQLDDPRLDPEVAEITREALRRMESAGAVLADRDSAVLDEAAACLEDILLVEAWEVHGPAVETGPEHFGAPTLRLFRTAGNASPDRRDAAVARRADVLPRAAALLDGVDFLVGPGRALPRTGRHPAHRHPRRGDRRESSPVRTTSPASPP